MLDGEDLIVVVVDAVVEDGLHDLVFTRLSIEKQGVELLKHMLHREGHVTVASRQIQVILGLAIQLVFDGTADVLIEEVLLKTLYDDALHMVFVHLQLLGEELDAVSFLFGRDEQQSVAFFIEFLGEKVSRQRVALVDDIDDGF